MGNAYLRMLASAISGLITAAIVESWLPMVWTAGLILVISADRAIYAGLLARCEAGRAPERLGAYLAWTVFQSVYANMLAVMLWFTPNLNGETLAAMFLCGGLANAAATLRAHSPLAMAGAGPTLALLLGLPVLEFYLGGARNMLELTPLVGGLLLMGYGVNLWRSLLASDAAQAEAEAAALRERQAAAAAAAAKSDMIKRMNDEMRTPMAALSGAAEHLRRAATSAQARAHISALAQASEVLKLVLEDLSDLDRLENGQLQCAPAPCDPRDIARGVVAAFRPAAQDKNLELFLDVARGVPEALVLDAARVRQVLFNLLANAVRYTNYGGVRVRIGARTRADGASARIAFTVADTGPGLSRSQLAMIFGRERVCAPGAGPGAGPGLGLAISLKLAKLMGGELIAKSELGEGSRFSLILDAPIAAARAAA